MKISTASYVENAMSELLNSEEYRKLFHLNYKTASDESDQNDAKACCPKCKCSKKECKCDTSDADDVYMSDADDNYAMSTTKCDSEECMDSSDMKVTAYEIALDSLVTASAALDEVGLVKSASFTLRIAELVSEAKKQKEKAKAKVKSKSKSDMKSKKPISSSSSSSLDKTKDKGKKPVGKDVKKPPVKPSSSSSSSTGSTKKK